MVNIFKKGHILGGVMVNFFKKVYILGGVKHLLASKIHDLVGVCDLCSETRGGQYLTVKSREVEAPPTCMFSPASLIKLL